jgi:hypothetical protein
MVPIRQVAHALFLEVSEQHLRLLPCARITSNRCLRSHRTICLLCQVCAPLLLLGSFYLLLFLSLLLIRLFVLHTWVLAGRFVP